MKAQSNLVPGPKGALMVSHTGDDLHIVFDNILQSSTRQDVVSRLTNALNYFEEKNDTETLANILISLFIKRDVRRGDGQPYPKDIQDELQ